MVASAAAVLFFAIAAVFSASDKFVSALIASSLALRAASTSAFAASFLATTGLSAAIAVVPSFCAFVRASFVATSGFAISSRAFCLSAFTLAIAASFSS